ncbi:hypothetical protein ZWY2020_049878 [Hordeum vulgare]|nr:hypothetical protein ZWY2020_049878 [Hordeum vulgare]
MRTHGSEEAGAVGARLGATSGWMKTASASPKSEFGEGGDRCSWWKRAKWKQPANRDGEGEATRRSRRAAEAGRHFGDAIALVPDNRVLFSNRSAAYASLGRYKEALVDADRTVALRPD